VIIDLLEVLAGGLAFAGGLWMIGPQWKWPSAPVSSPFFHRSTGAMIALLGLSIAVQATKGMSWSFTILSGIIVLACGCGMIVFDAKLYSKKYGDG
jgi:hypothetical protein